MTNLVRIIYSILVKVIPTNNLGDRIYSLIMFVRAHRRLPVNKELLNDYLYFLRHSDEGQNPLRAYVSDKEFVKDYVRARAGEAYNVPTLKILETMEAVKSFDFPQTCCIKPTHLSGEVIFRVGAEDIDFSVLEQWLKTNYYEKGREKNYRYLKPKIIVEPLIFDKTDNEDFKFFCFNGEAKFLQLDIDRRKKHTRLYFDRDWNPQEFSILKDKSSKYMARPSNLNAMLQLADRLSVGFEFVRVDLYTNGSEIYVGELTNWPENGGGYFLPRGSEKLASELLFR